MRKLLIILLFLPFASSAQEDTASSKIKMRIFITPELNSMYKDRILPYPQSIKNKVGYTTGINIQFVLKGRFRLETGLQLGQKNFTYTIEGLTFNSDIDPKTGFISSSRIVTTLSNYTAQVPVSLIYNFSKSNTGFYTSAGFGFGYQIERESETVIYYGNGTQSRYKGSQSGGNISLLVSAGYNMAVAQHVIFIEPVYQLYLREYETLAKFYTVGIKAGLSF